MKPIIKELEQDPFYDRYLKRKFKEKYIEYPKEFE